MAEDKDYRSTEYCEGFQDIEEKKKKLEDKIRKENPKVRIIYNKVHKRGEEYHKLFGEIYNNKCAYCGARFGLLPVESFEVDHFINEASYPKTTSGREEAGRIQNLIWACISCNRGKSGFTVVAPYDNILNPDNGNIAHVFERDDSFYIQIKAAHKDDENIKEFYYALGLNYEVRRLDFLLLQMEGKYEKEKDEGKRQKLGRIIYEMLLKRNKYTTEESNA